MKILDSLWKAPCMHTCVFHLLKTKPLFLPQIQRHQTHQTPGQEPGLRGVSQLYVNVAICRAAAPLPHPPPFPTPTTPTPGPQLGLPFGLRRV